MFAINTGKISKRIRIAITTPMNKILIFTLFISQFLFSAAPKKIPEFDTNRFLSVLRGEIPPQSHDLTMNLLWCAHYGNTLSQKTQLELRDHGIRLTPTRNTMTRNEGVGLDQYLDTPYFRVHYTLSGTNAVNTADNNTNGIPDYIDNMAWVLDSVYTGEIGTLGYAVPPGDGWVTTDNGGNDLYDVYVRQIAYGYYGYTQSEYYAQGNGDNGNTDVHENNAFTSYLVLRNNYSGFPNTTPENIRVTIAHEFFHAIQFGYDGWEEPWLLEATAVWMEETMYENINDCFQYMPTWFTSPQTSLNSSAPALHKYGSYIFFRYLDENWNGKPVIRAIFDSSVKYNSQNGSFSFKAINDGFNDHGLNFSTVFNGMVIANRILSSSQSAAPYRYQDAVLYKTDDHYSITGPAILGTVRSDTSWTSYQLHRYSSEYINLNLDHPCNVKITFGSNSGQNVIGLGITKTASNQYEIVNGLDLDFASSKYTDWICLALSCQDTTPGSNDYTVTITQLDTLGDLLTVKTIFPNPGNTKNADFTFPIQVNDIIKARISIVNILGQNIVTLFDGYLEPYSRQFSWKGLDRNGRSVSSGTYFFLVDTPNKQYVSKITWIK